MAFADAGRGGGDFVCGGATVAFAARSRVGPRVGLDARRMGTAGLSEVVAAGSGELRVEVVAGESAVTAARSQSPLKILTPRARGSSAWAYLSSFGGGMVAGDRTDLSIEVDHGARLFLSTQASTKIYVAKEKASRSRVRATVGRDALFAYVPDVAQCFAGARFHQTNRFELADESSELVFMDWYSSGRSARGERWAFAEYLSRTEVLVDGELVFFEPLRLKDDVAERMGRVNCVATLLLFGKFASQICKEVGSEPVTKRARLLRVASPIKGGAVARWCGESVDEVSRDIRRALDFLPELLGDNPFERKW